MSGSEKESRRERWILLDTLRGFTLIQMVLFHFLYDVCIVYGRAPGWNVSPLPWLWQQSICWTFILISGLVFPFSRSHLLRGLLLTGWGFVITLVTAAVLPSETIWFGVLNLIGISILLTAALEPLLRRIPPMPGILLAFFAFLVTRQVPGGFFGLHPFGLALPAGLYQFFPAAWLGFPPADFISSDYFPILPWIFLFWTGYYLHFLLRDSRFAKILTRGRVPLLTALGRHTLLVYLLHQPVCMLICMVLFGY